MDSSRDSSRDLNVLLRIRTVKSQIQFRTGEVADYVAEYAPRYGAAPSMKLLRKRLRNIFAKASPQKPPG